MIDAERTGERIRFMCARKGITVKRIQEELRIGAFQSIYNWFSGRALPTLENYYGLCRLLQVSMESLIVEETGCQPGKGICDWCVRRSGGKGYLLAEVWDQRRAAESYEERMAEYGKRLLKKRALRQERSL